MPLILAPLGNGGFFARRAEVQAARSAERAGIPFCEATLAVCSVEEVAAAVRQPAWFQLYMMKDRDYVQDLMSRAEGTGCTTLVFTVDMPLGGLRYRDVRNGVNGGLGVAKRLRRDFDLISHVNWVRDVVYRGRPLTFGNLEKALPDARKPQDFYGWIANQFDSSFTWADLSWVREIWKGKIVLKGILDADDAREAVDRGVDAIVVSNHGGRQPGRCSLVDRCASRDCRCGWKSVRAADGRRSSQWPGRGQGAGSRGQGVSDWAAVGLRRGRTRGSWD